MRAPLLFLPFLALSVSAAACAHPAHHHVHKPKVKAVAVLDAEHHDAKVVIVKQRRAPKAHCWKHAGHWHCHR